MSYFTSFFATESNPSLPIQNFWQWFAQNSSTFWSVVQQGDQIETLFFDQLVAALEKVHPELYFLTGMYDEQTVELIITADGSLKNIVFVEELIQQAPLLKGWKFTALKPMLPLDELGIRFNDDYAFQVDNLWFTPLENADYADEMDIMIHYAAYNAEDDAMIYNGVCIFLEHLLGELTFTTAIDSIQVKGVEEEDAARIPILQLKDYLKWRESEFSQKYDDTVRRDTTDDEYSTFESKTSNGYTTVGLVNTSVLEWEDCPTHPWILKVHIDYDGEAEQGFPSDEVYRLMEEFENDVMEVLTDQKGYLNVARETGENRRQIYFACSDFRYSSQIMHQMITAYANRLCISYELYADKYWQTFRRFR